MLGNMRFVITVRTENSHAYGGFCTNGNLGIQPPDIETQTTSHSVVTITIARGWLAAALDHLLHDSNHICCVVKHHLDIVT